MATTTLIKNATLFLSLLMIVRVCLRSNFLLPRNKIPPHLLNHPIHIQRDLISPSDGKDLLKLVEKIGTENGYPTNTVDTSFYHTEHEHIGEAIPAVQTPDGAVVCDNPFLVPSIDRKLCILAGRMDIAKHFKMKVQPFIEQYLRVDEDGDHVLQSVPCTFLGADNYCSIYEVRPKACREFPHTDRKKFHQISNLTLKNVAICPAAYNIVEEIKQRVTKLK